MKKWILELPTAQLNLPLCVATGQVFRWFPTEFGWEGVDGEHYYNVTWSDTEEGVRQFEVSSTGTAEDFKSLFRLDCDIDVIRAEILEACPALAANVKALVGLRLMRPSDAVESFVSFLCTPNNNLSRITRMVNYLASHGPVILEQGSMSFYAFPTLEVIADLDEEDLVEQKFGYRSRTIPAIAKEVINRGGTRYLRDLTESTYTEATAELRTISGIGPKLADCICLYALRHLESVPIDTHMYQSACRYFFPDLLHMNLTDRRYELISGHIRNLFGHRAGWAQQFLFVDSLAQTKAFRQNFAGRGEKYPTMK